jgi:hypothetical protein
LTAVKLHAVQEPAAEAGTAAPGRPCAEFRPVI